MIRRRAVLALTWLLLVAGGLAQAQSVNGGFIRFTPPATAGPGGGAPTDAQYIVASGNGTLSAERVCTDTATIDCDAGTAGQMKFNLILPLTAAVTCANPSYSFLGATTSGMCQGDGVQLQVNANGTDNSIIKLATGSARMEFYDATGVDGYVLFSNDDFQIATGGLPMIQGTPTTVLFGQSSTKDQIGITPVAKGSNSFAGTITSADLTGARTWTFPNATGTVALTSGVYTLVDDEDTPLTARTTLNFEGAGVTCVDDTDQTTCTIPGGGAGSVDTSGTPVLNDIARFTDADTIEGRSYAELRGDLDLEIGTDVQAYDADLTTYAGITPSANVQTLLGAADFAAARSSLSVGTMTVGTAAPGATACDAAGEAGSLYLQSGDPATVNGQLFRCTQTGPASWVWMPAGFQSGTTAPATCSVGNVFFDTDATAGSNWFGCTSANTWTLLGGGLADPGSNGMLSRTAANTTVARTITCGEGTSCSNGTGVSGNPTISADRAVVVFKGTGTDDPPAACGDTGDPFQLLDFYLETDTDESYQCVDIDTWALTGHVADDAVLVGTGTGLAKETIPDCDSASSALQYNQAGSAGSRFSCGTIGGSTFDPGTTFELYEEFVGGNTDSGVASIGNSNTYGSRYNSGDIDSNTPGDVGHPGGIVLYTHATNDNSGSGVAFASWQNSQALKVFAGLEWSFDTVFKIASTGAITNSAFMCGIAEDFAGDPFAGARGVWMIRDTDRSHTSFVFQICDSTTNGCQSAGDAANSETVASTISPSANTWYRFRMRRVASGVGGNPTVYMRVNDETEKTFCSSGCDDTLTNLNTSSDVSVGCAYLTRTTTETKASAIDYMYLKATGLTRY